MVCLYDPDPFQSAAAFVKKPLIIPVYVASGKLLADDDDGHLALSGMSLATSFLVRRLGF